jgi:Co/Zn/Cd efflux system component
MKKTTFYISKMDCPSEVNMIRMKLDDLPVIKMDFDIPLRKLSVYHEGEITAISEALNELHLGATLRFSEDVEPVSHEANQSAERRMLMSVLMINAALFVVEMVFGLVSASMGLVADSLDMLADAIVYGLSLYAVGHAVAKKKKVAEISGYLQLFLAVLGLIEVIRRFLGFEETPGFQVMIIVSCLALAGNSICLWLLQKSKSEEAHMKASMIFTSNDVIVNLGVIAAGILVYFTSSRYPDLVVGLIVFGLVARGAFRILKLAR